MLKTEIIDWETEFEEICKIGVGGKLWVNEYLEKFQVLFWVLDC